jgi:hypothetical protein
LFVKLIPILLALLVPCGYAVDSVHSVDSRPETVHPIKAPKNPLPSEEKTDGITNFGFIVYGDTRGRRDGTEVQYEHSLIIDSMLKTIAEMKKAKDGPQVRFVLQSGDAVVDGKNPKQWNESFVSLVNRITTEAGIPYYLAPGNHDVTAANDIGSASRHKGLSNYLAAVNHLTPDDENFRRLAGYPVFAFGFGNSFFLALDSNLAGDMRQYAWVSGQLENLDHDRYQNIFAFFHHPVFSSGGHGGSKIEGPTRDLRKMYMPLFRKHHVRALLTGHEHLFEHWVERYTGSDGRKYRIDELVTGGGGAPLIGFRGTPDVGPYEDMYKSEHVKMEHLVVPGPTPGDNPYHYVVVEVNGTDLKLRVVGVDWGRDFKPYRSNTAVLQ